MALVTGVTVAYALVFLPLDSTLGNGAGILAIIPVIVTAWLFGWRGGLASGLLAFPLNSLLVILAGSTTWSDWIGQGGVIGTTALMLVGTIVGWLRDLRDQLQRERQALGHLVELETVVSTTSTKFATAAFEDMDTAILQALEAIGEFAGIHRSYLFLFSHDAKKMDNTHEWCADGIVPQIAMLKDIPIDTFPWLMKSIWRGESVYVPRVADLPPEAKNEKEEFEREGIQSILLVPVAYGGAVRGFIGFDSVGVEKVWEDGDVRLLRMTSEMFAGALERLEAEEELQKLYDQLELRVEERTAELSKANVLLEHELDEHRRAEEALKEIQERLHTVVMSAPVILWALDSDGIITLSDGQGLATLRLQPGQVVGQSVFDVYRDVPAILDDHRTALSGKAAGSTVALGDYTFTYMITPARSEHGDVVGVTGLAYDITEQTRLQEQLVQADKLTSLGTLVAGVAHEVNNPLAGALGRVDLMLRRDPEEALKGDLQLIHDETMRAVRIMQNLLSFSRQREFEKMLTPINEIVESVVDLLSYQFRVNNVEVVKDLQPDLPEIMADANQLRQVFLNLITNAAQAIAESHDGGMVSVKTRRVEDAIQVTIADDGPGIPTETLGKIFDPFFTTKAEGKGTGLGLSISYGIVQEHGGNIGVESQVGKGTAFTVGLPVATGVSPNPK